MLRLLGAAGAATVTRIAIATDSVTASASVDEETFLRTVVNGDLTAVLAMLDTDASLAKLKDGQGRSAYVLARLGGHRDVAAALRNTNTAGWR